MRIISICMDTKKDCKIPEYGDLAKLQEGKAVVGFKQLRKALERGTAKWVFLARNADPEMTGSLRTLCEAKQVSYTWVSSMTALGHACGIDVGAAAAAVVE